MKALIACRTLSVLPMPIYGEEMTGDVVGVSDCQRALKVHHYQTQTDL